MFVLVLVPVTYPDDDISGIDPIALDQRYPFAAQFLVSNPFLDSFLIWTLPIYVADLGVKYKRVGNFRTFLRQHWVSIILTIPWLRALKILRFLRLLRLMRAGRVARILKLNSARRKLIRIWQAQLRRIWDQVQLLIQHRNP